MYWLFVAKRISGLYSGQLARPLFQALRSKQDSKGARKREECFQHLAGEARFYDRPLDGLD
jgi:hypothetical protein